MLFAVFIILLNLFGGGNSAPCENATVLTDPAGLITTDGFPNDYPSTTDCDWTIVADVGKAIHLDFVSFLASGAFSIHDGEDENCTTLFSRTGTLTADVRVVVTTSSNVAFIKFKSTNTGMGWALYYRTVEQVPAYSWKPNMTLDEVTFDLWDIFLPNDTAPELEPNNGHLRLIDQSQEYQTGALWSKTPLDIDDFVIRVEIEESQSSSLRGSEGYALYFVPNSTIERPPSLKNFGVRNTSWIDGLALYASTRLQSVFAQNTGFLGCSNKKGAVSGRSLKDNCYSISGSYLRRRHVLYTSINLDTIAATVCKYNSSGDCRPSINARGLKHDAAIDPATKTLFFGIVAMGNNVSYDDVDVISIDFYKPVQVNCPSGCPGFSFCSGLDVCTCNAGYTSDNCSIPMCARPCENGGSCVEPNTCECAEGFVGLQCAATTCISNTTINSTLSGFIYSQGFDMTPRELYRPKAKCGWIVEMPSPGILLDVSIVMIAGSGMDHLLFYDSPDDNATLLYNTSINTQFQFSLLVPDTDVFIKWSTNEMDEQAGWSIHYRQVSLDSQFSYVPLDGNSTIANWNIYAGTSNAWQPTTGALRLTSETASQNGAMWSKVPVNSTDFMVSLTITVNNTSTSMVGVGLFLATEDSIKLPPLSSSPYGIIANAFSGLGLIAGIQYQHIFAHVKQISGDISSLISRCNSGSAYEYLRQGASHRDCVDFGLMRKTFTMHLRVQSGRTIRVVMCASDQNPTCRLTIASYYKIVNPDLFNLTNGPLFLGVGGYNTQTQFDQFDVNQVQFWKTNQQCPYDCHGNGDCKDSGECTCYPDWMGDYCEIPYCDACHNGGTCEWPRQCRCTEGWAGGDCSKAYCVINTTIAAVDPPESYTSDNYPNGNYEPNTRCGWFILADPGNIIELTFTVGTMESNSDFIEIYDGLYPETDPLLYRSSASQYEMTIRASTGGVFVWFTSDSDGRVGNGFTFTFSRISTAVTDVSGYIASTSFGTASYIALLDNGWLINFPTPNHFWVGVETATLDDGGDFFEVYDGASLNDPRIIYNTKDRFRSAVGNFDNSSLLLRFKSNGTIEGTGYKFTFQQYSPQSACFNPAIITGQSTGSISSPNYGSGYYNSNETCSWQITVAAGSVVSITMTVKLMDSFGGDYIRLYDGASNSDLMILESAASQYVYTVKTTGNNLFVVFESNADKYLGEGFNLTFSTVVVPNENVLIAELKPYPAGAFDYNLNNFWLLNVPAGDYHWINVGRAQVFNVTDYISIHDGTTTLAPYLVEKWYGHNAGVMLESTASSILVSFTSDDKDSGKDFTINTKQATAAALPQCSNDVVVLNASESGAIWSPNYGKYYTKNMSCSWIISCNPGKSLWLELTMFLAAMNDILTIYNGIDEMNSPIVLRSASGQWRAQHFASESEILIKFTSNMDAVIGSGFNLTYKQVTLNPIYSYSKSGNFTDWESYKSYSGPALNTDNSIQLVPRTASRSGVVWNTSPFVLSDFIMKIDVSISSDGTNGPGLAAMWVDDATRVLTTNFDTNVSPFGIRWNAMRGLAIRATPQEGTVYAVNAVDAVADLAFDSCNCDGCLQSTCGLLNLRQNFSVIVGVKTVSATATAISTTTCYGTRYCLQDFYGEVSNLNNTLYSTGQIFFGLGAMNDATNFESVDIHDISVYMVSEDCFPACSENGYCYLGRCECRFGWGGTTCDDFACYKPCLNGGSCAGPNLCWCPDGFAGIDCSVSFCVTNQTITLTDGAPSGTAATDNYGIGNYYDNMRCGWLIQTTVNDTYVDLTIEVGTINNNGDYIQIIDVTNGVTVMESEANNYIANFRGESLFVYFTTNNDKSVGTGFKMTFFATKTRYEYAELQSLKYKSGGGYAATADDAWTFRNPMPSRSFWADLTVGTLTTAATDFVEMYDGPFLNQSISRMNTNNDRAMFASSGSEMSVKFKSGPVAGTGTGFRLVLTRALPTYWSSACQATNSISIDPNLPYDESSSNNMLKYPSSGYYVPNTNCTWILQVPPGYSIWIRVAVSVIDEGGEDHISVYDNDENQLLLTANSTSFKHVLVTSSNLAIIRFVSNSDLRVGNQFTVVFKAVMYRPALSFEQAGDVSNWDTYLPYVGSVLQPNGTIQLVQDLTSQTGAMWNKIDVNMTEIFIQATLTIGNTGTSAQSTSLGIFLVPRIIIESPGSFTSVYGINMASFRGVGFFFNAVTNSAFVSFENGSSPYYPDPTVLRKSCSNVATRTGGSCAAATDIRQTIKVSIALTREKYMFMSYCADTCRTAFVYNISYPNALNSFGDLLTFGVGASNEGTGADLVEVVDLRFYTSDSCSTPCTNNATCIGPNQCSCPAGWTGAGCDQPFCSPSCRNGGTCFMPNQCNCTAGWDGAICNIPLCTNACQNGNCTAPDTCTCEVGWTGPLCEQPICNPSCHVIGGNCSMPNQCTCNVGWNGTLCDSPICTTPCLNGGLCTAPDTCSCNTALWNGPLCETPVCTPACDSVGGNCSAPGQCTCNQYWEGPSCEHRICKNNGNFAPPNQCNCSLGWDGPTCDVPLCAKACLNGHCSAPDVCSCQTGWIGDLCELPLCNPSCHVTGGNCSLPNQCTCNVGWNGTLCDSPICTTACLNGGLCTAPDTCTCNTALWNGSLCETPVCTPACDSVGGNCSAPGQCTCNQYWEGPSCEHRICNNNGTFAPPNQCNCSLGWNGPTCDVPLCSNACQNGNCSAPDVCLCQTGWTGALCDQALCTSACHSQGGSCTAPDECTCNFGWNGTLCENPICPSPCLNDGFCSGPQICTCNTTVWSGALCEIPVCTPDCNPSGGHCVAPGNCSCFDRWFGEGCEYANCDVPCRNNATCSSPNVCTCVIGFSGSLCETRTGTFTSEEFAAMSDEAIMQNLEPIKETVLEMTTAVAKTGDPEKVTDMLDTLGSMLDRFGNITEMSPEKFSDIAALCSAAADAMMTEATGSINNASNPAKTDDDLSDMNEDTLKCKIDDKGKPQASITDKPVQSDAAKGKLRKMFNSFTSMLVTMFANLRNILKPGMKMNFAGDFYGATVFHVRLKDIPGMLLETNLADAEFPFVNDPIEMFGSIPSKCSALSGNSTIPVVLSAFIVNVVDVDQPFNMPTVAARMYCPEGAELALNPNIRFKVVGKPSVKKASLLSRQKIDSQCDISRVKCDLDENAAEMGSMANFPLTANAGDFVIIFPNIDFNYSAYIYFNATPTPKRYHWHVNVTTKSYEIAANNSFEKPRSHQNKGSDGDLRIIIRARAISQYLESIGLPGDSNASLSIYVFTKKNFSAFETLENLPPAACELQRTYGYHLRIGLAKDDKKKASRKRRAVDLSTVDGFELEPESTEKAVVFKSSYFGDFGADLAVSPNTIEFSDVFANFAELVANNAGVLAFQCVAIAFFFVGIFIAFKFDKEDLREWAFLPIVSNTRHQKCRYLVSVHCSGVKRFELEPMVSIRLIGNIYDTNWRLLEDGVRPKIFNGKHPANFALHTQLPLGRIDGIELKVESKKRFESGKKPLSIHIDRVTLVDVERGLKYVYLVKARLFAGGRIKKTALATEDEMKGYSYLITGHSKTSLTDVHPWISTISRPLPSNWTRVERLACVVSALFMAMLVNAMFYGKESNSPKVGLDVGGVFKISWFTVWTSFIGCVIVIPPTAAIAFIFKRIKRKSAEKSEWATVFNMKVADDTTETPKTKNSQKDKPKKRFELPYYCVIIAWILVSSCIGTSAFFVVMYSLSWGQDKSLAWLSGMVLNIIQDIILIQPVKVLLGSIVSATMHSLPDDGLSMGRLTYNPNNNRRKVELFYKLRAVLTGIFHHAIYVFIFAVVVATMTNSYSYRQLRALKPTFALKGAIDPFLGTVTDYPQIYQWLDQTVLAGLLNGNQLERGGIYRTPSALYESTQNPHVSLLGPVRLRQQRVQMTDCPVARPAVDRFAKQYSISLTMNNASSGIATICQKTFGESLETRTFNKTWDELAYPQEYFHYDNMTQFEWPWIYRASDGLSYSGWETTYQTGGYWVDLPRRLNKALAVVESLKANRWLDNATTALFVDFNLFNVQTNLFIPVKIAFEALSAGGMSYHIRMFPLQLYMYSGASSMLVFIIQGLWVILLFSHVVRVLRACKKEGFRSHWRNGWNILDACQILLGLIIVGLFATRIYFVINFIEKIQSLRTTFIELDFLVYWEDLLFCLFGIQFFMAMMCFFRHLTVNKHWAILLSTLSKGKLDLISYGSIFVAATIFFAGIAYLVMGTTFYNFSSYTRGIMTLIQSIIGSIDLTQIHSKFYVMICMMYTAVVVFLGTNMFVMLILAAYSDVVDDVEKSTDWDAELSEFMAAGVKDILTRKKKPSDEAEEPLNDQNSTESFKPIGMGESAKLENLVNRFDLFVDRQIDDYSSEDANRRDRCQVIWAADQVDAVKAKSFMTKIKQKRPFSETDRLHMPTKEFLYKLSYGGKKPNQIMPLTEIRQSSARRHSAYARGGLDEKTIYPVID